MHTFVSQRRFIGFAAAVVVLLTCGVASAATWYVDVSATTGSNNGFNWVNAFTNLQSGIAAASSGDEVWVAAGIYIPGANRDYSFSLKAGVKVFCGFQSGALLLSERNPLAYPVFLSGDVNGDDDPDDPFNFDLIDDNVYHVVKADSTVTPPQTGPPKEWINLDGATISGGAAYAVGEVGGYGGGILINGGSPTIRNCTIARNSAAWRGGGIMCLDTETPPIIRNCKFITNAITIGHGKGGGLDTNHSVTVIGCDFLDNFAAEWGGGLSVEENGENSVVRVINCKFIGNECPRYGAGIYASGEDGPGTDELVLEVTNCLFNNNRATNLAPSLSDGGAIWSSSLISTITSCTFVNNFVGQGIGGGLAHYFTDCRLANCLFYNNFAEGGANDFGVSGGALLMTYCAAQDALGGDTNVDLSTQSPGFVDANGDNEILGDADDDYRLTCNSPCLNEGFAVERLTDEQDVDEDGNLTELARELNFGFRGVGAVDIGCYEKPLGATCAATDISDAPCGDGDTDIDDLLLVINSWGACPTDIPCYADIWVSSTVDIDDLLAVINGWGSCQGGSEQMPTSINDCMTAATNKGLTAFSPEWNEAVNGCVDALCAAEIIDCD